MANRVVTQGKSLGQQVAAVGGSNYRTAENQAQYQHHDVVSTQPPTTVDLIERVASNAENLRSRLLDFTVRVTGYNPLAPQNSAAEMGTLPTCDEINLPLRSAICSLDDAQQLLGSLSQYIGREV